MTYVVQLVQLFFSFTEILVFTVKQQQQWNDKKISTNLVVVVTHLISDVDDNDTSKIYYKTVSHHNCNTDQLNEVTTKKNVF